jgi:hypothetical protein
MFGDAASESTGRSADPGHAAARAEFSRTPAQSPPNTTSEGLATGDGVETGVGMLTMVDPDDVAETGAPLAHAVTLSAMIAPQTLTIPRILTRSR